MNITTRKQAQDSCIPKFTFQEICGDHLIDPNIALENENVWKAIKSNDEDLLRDALENEF